MSKISHWENHSQQHCIQVARGFESGLSIKYVNQRFRFSGIGGETTTEQVALLPVCFGRLPGLICAAILEDTSEAPFLLSLPILKSLETQVHLSKQVLHYHAIQEEGKMF